MRLCFHCGSQCVHTGVVSGEKVKSAVNVALLIAVWPLNTCNLTMRMCVCREGSACGGH